MKKLPFILMIVSTITFSSCDSVEPSSSGSTPISPSEVITYTVSFDSNGGTYIDSQQVKEGEKVTKPTNPIKDGYTFVSWTYENTSWNFDNLVTSNITLVAAWTINTYHITYFLDGGENSPYNPTTYTVEDEIDLVDPTRDGYTFNGWRYHEDIVNTIPKGTTGNITFVATWVVNSYKINLSVSHDNRGIVTGSGNFTYNTSVSVNATANDGYKFIGWYNEDNKVSEEPIYTFIVPAHNVSLEARFDFITYNITYVLDDGVNDPLNPSTYNIESNITLKNPSREGYRFDSWKLNGEKITNISKMMGDITLVATWIKLYYVHVIYDSSKGSVTGEGLYSNFQLVTLTASPNNGYKLGHWILNGKTVTETENVFQFFMGEGESTCEAVWEKVVYNITYDLDGGTNDPLNPTTYTVEDEFDLANPTKTEYIFTGWTLDGEVINKISKGMYGDIILKATWVIKKYDVACFLSIADSGVITGVGNYAAGQVVSVTCTVYENYKFMGWYNDSGTLLTYDETYTFTMPSNGVTLKADVWELSEYEWLVAHGGIPTKSNNQIIYGLYPQTVLNDYDHDDQKIIYELYNLNLDDMDEKTGWYFFDNEYYAYLVATPAESGYTFENGNEIRENCSYWFKCEPIVWDIITSSNDEYYLASNLLLDTHVFHSSSESRKINGETIYRNNYMYSDIRAWLNGYNGSNYSVENYTNKGFLNIAFNLDSHYIKTTTVANSDKTTDYYSNVSACADKVFLPSYDDYMNEDYGFPNSVDNASDKRERKTTDYARTAGCNNKKNDSHDNSGSYWTRSPEGGVHTWYIHFSGRVKYMYSNNEKIGVRPAIILNKF